MITGFNTDVEHDGVVYHVQTEDKGINSPLILSLVYVGGAILASKRSPYDDLIASGFDEHRLTERLNRQHKLICAAIHAGRIEDLKRMNQRDTVAPAVSQRVVPVRTILDEAQSTGEFEANQPAPSVLLPLAPSAPVSNEPAPPTALEPYVIGNEAAGKTDFMRVGPAFDNLHLDWLEERELRAGDFVTFRIRISSGPVENRDSVPDADVTLKILGTSFKPLVCSARTDQDGVAILFAGLPRFTSGRAAILIRAFAHGHEAELRRIIHPV